MRRAFVVLLALSACTPEPEPFELSFAATDGASRVACGDTVSGLGPAGAYSVGLSDLRFYVSNLKFWDDEGEAVEASLDGNDFQYAGETDWVGLIDLTSNTAGDCADGAISFSEGTARTNDAITGSIVLKHVTGVSFDVGVSQELMQEVIADNTAEAAPSPLNEMYWSWASGYRHLVFNVTATDGAESGEGYVHIGSLDCGADGENALESRDACGKVNTPSVRLDDFDLTADTVAVDLTALLADLTFITPIIDHETMEVIGEEVGVACHSFPGQADCAPLFDNLGLDPETGGDSASDNAAFGVL